jgi:hypothetical protein
MVAKMLALSMLAGYRQSLPSARPRVVPFVAIVDRILEADKGQPTK